MCVRVSVRPCVRRPPPAARPASSQALGSTLNNTCQATIESHRALQNQNKKTTTPKKPTGGTAAKKVIKKKKGKK